MTVGVINQFKALPLLRLRVLVERYVAFRKLQDAKGKYDTQAISNELLTPLRLGDKFIMGPIFMEAVLEMMSLPILHTIFTSNMQLGSIR